MNNCASNRDCNDGSDEDPKYCGKIEFELLLNLLTTVLSET